MTPDAAFAAVGEGVWRLGARHVPPPPTPPVPSLEGRKIVFVQRPNSVQSSISVGNFTIRRNDPRWPVLNVANQIYGGAFDSRLVRNIREEKGYTYSPQSIFQAMGQAGPLPRRGRRPQRRHRRDAEGDLQRDRQVPHRRARRRRSSTTPRPTRAACS